jgi:ferrous iron transport protein B
MNTTAEPTTTSGHLSLPQLTPPGGGEARAAVPRVLLVGNPNAGKTALFNTLTGLRGKTANLAGTTVELRRAQVTVAGRRVELVDLPGLYGLDAASPEERVTVQAMLGEADGAPPPELVLLVLDATNLERNLYLAGQVLELGLPTLVVLTLADAARSAGITVDANRLADQLGKATLAVSVRTGEGIAELRGLITETLADDPPTADAGPAEAACSCVAGCHSCPFADRYAWAQGVAEQARPPEQRGHVASSKLTDAIDAIFTHPVLGVASFIGVMLGVFYLIFALAGTPMDLIDGVFVSLGEAAANVLPDGLIESLVVDGIIAGVGGVLIFLPQIAILFFCITLLEDSGYLARAAFVMERLMRKVGLPGKAFVPMLSAHACAIPAIMATRVIESKRDRLATILTLPLMSCSARLPVYAMIAALLFGDEPGKAAMLFLGAYLLGIGAALGAAGVLKLTILRGRTSPMIIELPSYRLPTLRNALMTAFDRSKVFVRKAGTIILAISIGLWILATFPQLPDAQTAGLDEAAAGQAQLEHSIAGRLGQAVEPVFEPLGYDWRINVGVVSSFAAREVVVSTLAIVTGVGEDAAEDEGLVDTLRGLERPDGALLFTVPVALSLLVFFVLAMQCLPTQAVTKRETGSWKWALLQLGYMTALAYGAALVTYQVARLVV